ncbi:MAG: radical SAM protein, partial [Desulfobacteraceae bacterium]|nr:radical SAM protein [Desulfobacteraceae bacterium]
MSNCENPGLYIHVPFCRTKCPYCDFYSITSLSLVPDWREALLREILAYKDRCTFFDSLYLGGGTPSLLSGRDLKTLFESLFRHFSFSPDTEITIEANPDDITREKLEMFKELG